MRRIVVTSVALLGLTACARPAPTIAEFQEACASYGYAAGTPEQAACVERTVTAYNDRIAAANAARSAGLAAAALNYRPPPARYTVAPSTTTCVPLKTMGGGVTCW